MVELSCSGLNSLAENAACARLGKDVKTNGIIDVERRAREYFYLEHRIKELESELARANGNLKKRDD